MKVLHRGDSGPEVRKLQAGVNKTLDGHGFGWRKVKVDGDAGALTFKAANLAGWLQGLSRAQLEKINGGTLTIHAQEILRHERARSEAQKHREHARRDLAVEIRHHHKHPPPDADGISTYANPGGAPIQVASWWVGEREGPDGSRTNWLAKMHEWGWEGYVVSGYRTPEYSEQLCYQMCGAPSCPGRCAGRSSNHSQIGPPMWGAIDVSDYANFARIAAEHNCPFRNQLGAADPVHFSYSGH